MKVKFRADRQLAGGKNVMQGDVVEVSTDDGKAFIKQGIAEAIKPKKEILTDG